MTEKVINTAFTLKPSTIKILKDKSAQEGIPASRIAERILRRELLGESTSQLLDINKLDLLLKEVQELKLLVSDFIK